MNKIKQQKMMCYFEENKINIKTLPTNELMFLNYIKEDFRTKKEQSIVAKYFRIDEFYDDEIAYQCFFKCYKDFAMENINNDSYEDDELIEIVAKGTYIGTCHYDNSIWIVYYNGAYYAIDDETNFVKLSNDLMMFPIGLWGNRYDCYLCCKDSDMTEEEFNSKEETYELKNFILQDWKPYQEILRKYNIEVDLSYDGLRKKIQN